MRKFCPKCHREAYRLEETEETMKIVQGGGTVLNLNRQSTVSMNLNCPSGHPVKLEIKPREVSNV